MLAGASAVVSLSNGMQICLHFSEEVQNCLLAYLEGVGALTLVHLAS